MKQFLQAAISLDPTHDFDGISFHPYCCRTDVFPEPYPSSIKSDSSPQCTGGVNAHCRTPMMDQVALMKSALCDPSISAHYCGKPIGTTEGGFNHNNNLADSKNITISGSGTTVTATSTTDLPADWTTGTKVRIDLANPTPFNTGADGYVERLRDEQVRTRDDGHRLRRSSHMDGCDLEDSSSVGYAMDDGPLAARDRIQHALCL